MAGCRARPAPERDLIALVSRRHGDEATEVCLSSLSIGTRRTASSGLEVLSDRVGRGGRLCPLRPHDGMGHGGRRSHPLARRRLRGRLARRGSQIQARGPRLPQRTVPQPLATPLSPRAWHSRRWPPERSRLDEFSLQGVPALFAPRRNGGIGQKPGPARIVAEDVETSFVHEVKQGIRIDDPAPADRLGIIGA